MKIISSGEIIWDLFDGSEHLGGAPLNFAVNARRLGHTVFLLSAVGSDPRGLEACSQIASFGVAADFVQRIDSAPTGTASVVIDSQGQPRFTIERPAAYDFVMLDQPSQARLAALAADLIYYGTLNQTSELANEALEVVFTTNPGARRFYDVNLRPGSFNKELVRRLISSATIMKLNADEVDALNDMFGQHFSSLEAFCRGYAERFALEALCVTRGEKGCAMLVGDRYVETEGFPVRVADTVGSGDAFAAAFAHGLLLGWSPDETADFANRVGALIASRPGATPAWTIDEAYALTRPA